MQLTEHLKQHFDDHLRTTERTVAKILPDLEKAIQLCHETVTQRRRILVCGNGGSASDAQHFVAELVGRFEREREPLAAVALSTDTSILTAVGNDYGFDHVFSRQVAALGQTGDVLIGISTSGNSPNVLRAMQQAHDNDMRVIALTGRDGGQMAQGLSGQDVLLCVPDQRTMRIQEMHILLLHLICEGIDAQLLGEPK
ncbi:phosphoheptose isomerase [Orrella daihaiensis]|uniref:Phosphoheptose isomerase n=1 Tax=Orrella daihaiensis TaxID=2782176 RepID=A0ABY4AK57_9BURK|nr:phosphoheptose isomerase [Orrella daihaiensis]UOD50652.1 phosphoheptose isomerase [Orrella daihaiensis]